MKTDYIIHKILCNIIVLSILASDDYQIPISNLVEETHTSKTKLTQLITVLPIRLSVGTNVLTLKLPSQIKAIKPFFSRRRK